MDVTGRKWKQKEKNHLNSYVSEKIFGKNFLLAARVAWPPGLLISISWKRILVMDHDGLQVTLEWSEMRPYKRCLSAPRRAPFPGDLEAIAIGSLPAGLSAVSAESLGVQGVASLPAMNTRGRSGAAMK